MSEEKSDEEKAKGPLPNEAWSWIMLLTGEINKVEMKLATYWNAGLIILIALLGVAVAALVASLQSDVTSIEDNVYKILALALIISAIVIGILYETRYRSSYLERLKLLINIRHDVMISGKLTDFSEIQRRWEEYIRKYYGKFLEKLEMNEAKKELDERKGNHEEKDSRKNNKEQKEILQIIQSDIRDIKENTGDIKENLQEIKDMMAGTKNSSMWSTSGNVLLGVGILGLGIGISLKSLILPIIGTFLILSGVGMIHATYGAKTDVSKYPNKLGMKALTELWHINRRLLFAIITGFVAVIILLGDVLLTLCSVLML